jgi:hypothetical protein
LAVRLPVTLLKNKFKSSACAELAAKLNLKRSGFSPAAFPIRTYTDCVLSSRKGILIKK